MWRKLFQTVLCIVIITLGYDALRPRVGSFWLLLPDKILLIVYFPITEFYMGIRSVLLDYAIQNQIWFSLQTFSDENHAGLSADLLQIN